MVVVPIVGAFTAISTIAHATPQMTLESVLIYTGLAMLTAAATVTFVLGLSLLNPAFSEKSGNYMTNLMITIFGLSNGLFLIPLVLLRLPLLDTLCFISIPLSWLAGITLLYLGYRKLSGME